MARSAEFESGSRPLRWEDMSAQEQRVSQGLISQQSENIGARMTAKAATTKGSEKRKFENAAVHPDLVEQPQTLEQATDRLITGMHQAAQPEFTMPGEHLAGGEFYYQHGGAIRTAAKAADRIEDVAISSASRMSPRTTPTAERKTVVALGKAHGRGSVTFNDQVLNHLAQGTTTTRVVITTLRFLLSCISRLCPSGIFLLTLFHPSARVSSHQRCPGTLMVWTGKVCARCPWTESADRTQRHAGQQGGRSRSLQEPQAGGVPRIYS
jgi:hypothetical protein